MRSLESSVAGAGKELLLQLLLQVPVPVFWGHWGAAGRVSGMPLECLADLAKLREVHWQALPRGFSFMCGREVTFRVSQEPDVSVEALLEGCLLFDSIKENLCIHGFWLDSSVENPDLSFRNWLIYEHKLHLSSPSMKRKASECIVCRRNLVVIPLMKMMVNIPAVAFPKEIW